MRIDDERLELVTITGIDVDNEMNRATVFFDSLAGESGDEAIIEVLEQHRRRMQASINRQIRAKKTPVLDFRPDEVIRAAERIDEILRCMCVPGLAAVDVDRPTPPAPDGRLGDASETLWRGGDRRRSTASPSSTSRRA